MNNSKKIKCQKDVKITVIGMSRNIQKIKFRKYVLNISTSEQCVSNVTNASIKHVNKSYVSGIIKILLLNRNRIRVTFISISSSEDAKL